MTNWLSNLSPSITVGSLGAIDLLLTTFSPSQAVRGIGTAVESDTLGGVLATISLVGTELEIIAELAGFLFFGYVVYEFFPRVYPEELAVFTDRRGFRVLAIFYVIALSQVAATALQPVSDPVEISLNLGVSVVIVLILCVVFVYIISSRNTVDIGPARRAASERLSVNGLSGGRNDIKRTSFRYRLLDSVYVGLMIALPLPFISLAVVVAGSLYPIPEGLAVGWALISTVDSRSNQSVGDRLPNRERVDLEDSAFDLVVNVARSPKGLSTVVPTFQGFAGAVIFVGALNSNTPRFVREGLRAIRSDPLFAWSVLGAVLVLLVSGLFAVWFWARVIRRIPTYLQAWNTSKADSSPLSEETLPDPITRPVGLLLPFAVTALPATAFVQTLRFDYFFGIRPLLLSAYGVVWPLSIIFLGWAVYQTRRIEPQPPLSDGRALPVGLLVVWAVVLLLEPLGRYVRQASGTRIFTSTEGVEILIIPLVLFLFTFYYPDLEARGRGAKGWRSRQANIAMFGFGLLCAVGGLLDVGGIGQILSITAALFTGAPLWTVLTDKYLY